MVIGLLRVEVHVPRAQSLKDKRSVLKSLRDQLRSRFNVAVAEVEADERWQRATLGIVTLSGDRTYVQGLLRRVREWLQATGLAALIRVEEEYL